MNSDLCFTGYVKVEDDSWETMPILFHFYLKPVPKLVLVYDLRPHPRMIASLKESMRERVMRSLEAKILSVVGDLNVYIDEFDSRNKRYNDIMRECKTATKGLPLHRLHRLVHKQTRDFSPWYTEHYDFSAIKVPFDTETMFDCTRCIHNGNQMIYPSACTGCGVDEFKNSAPKNAGTIV